MELIIPEHGYLAKTISTSEEMESALRLRHKVFREELRWVDERPDGLDIDEFDLYAQSIVIYSPSFEIIGHVRLIKAPHPYMIEHDFSALLPKCRPFVKTSNMAESTRICVEKEFRTAPVGDYSIAHLLYKAVYQWCVKNGIRYLVTIIERRYYVYLKKLFPFEPLGEFQPMGEGVMSGIAALDFRRLEYECARKSPKFLEWMTDTPIPVPSAPQIHELY